MTHLNGKVAVVTGASQGVGKGVALALADAGATVYATGRSIDVAPGAWPEAVIPVRCDHTNDAEVEAVFERVRREQGRVNVLVNNAWGGYERMVENGQFTWPRPFWEQ